MAVVDSIPAGASRREAGKYWRAFRIHLAEAASAAVQVPQPVAAVPTLRLAERQQGQAANEEPRVPEAAPGSSPERAPLAPQAAPVPLKVGPTTHQWVASLGQVHPRMKVRPVPQAAQKPELREQVVAGRP